MRYDWERIRSEYVAGSDEVTLEALSKTHGCGFSTIRRRSSHEMWNDQRSQYRDKTDTKTREKSSTKEAEIRVRHMQIAQAMQTKAIQRLQGMDPTEMPVGEVRKYLKDAAEIERKAAGIADEVEHGIRIVIDERDTRL